LNFIPWDLKIWQKNWGLNSRIWLKTLIQLWKLAQNFTFFYLFNGLKRKIPWPGNPLIEGFKFFQEFFWELPAFPG